MHPGRRALVLSIAALMVSLSNLGAQSSPTVDDIVAKYLAAKGGAEKLRAIKSVKLTGRLKRQGQRGEVQVASWAKRPNMMRREITFEGQSIVSAFDGTTVWGLNPMMSPFPQEVTGPQADLTRQDAADFDTPLLDYKTKGYTVELVGTEPVQGITMHHLRLTKKTGGIQDYYLNSETFLESKTVTQVELAGKKGINTTEYASYKDVDGIMVPFVIRQLFNGQPVVEVAYDQVEFNVPIEDSFFKMPKK
jgi:outer membrane lipoprotein-sorting protein